MKKIIPFLFALVTVISFVVYKVLKKPDPVGNK